MSRVGFQKSVRMFHKFSEETTRRRGGDQSAREGIAHLAAIEAVLKGERAFGPELLQPLAAFTNLLQSSQLPPDFGDYSFGDALLAVEAAQQERRQNEPQVWEFEGESSPEAATKLQRFSASVNAERPTEHASKLRRFVLDAAQTVEAGSLLIVGALAEPSLPLAELCARFARVTLNDLDLQALEERVRASVPEPHRERVKLERYDPTGSYAAFTQAVDERVSAASGPADAQERLSSLLQSYDVSAGSAGVSAVEEKPNLAISAMLLSRLGEGLPAYVAAALDARGWSLSASVLAELELFRCLLAQHHIHALLRRARAAVLISAVSEVDVESLPNGKKSARGEPRDLLGVERLEERLPEIAEIKAEASWELAVAHPNGKEKLSLLTLVEAVLV